MPGIQLERNGRSHAPAGEPQCVPGGVQPPAHTSPRRIQDLQVEHRHLDRHDRHRGGGADLRTEVHAHAVLGLNPQKKPLQPLSIFERWDYLITLHSFLRVLPSFTRSPLTFKLAIIFVHLVLPTPNFVDNSIKDALGCDSR